MRCLTDEMIDVKSATLTIPAALAKRRRELRSGSQNFAIVTTDRRIMFVEQGMIRSNLEDFPYDKVSSVKSETGMRSGKLTIFTSGNKAELKDIHPKARVTEIGDYVRARISAGSSNKQSEPTAAPAAPPDGPMEQLKKLGELRDAGVLNEAEFEAKKTELLSRM
ncbi:MAG: PH domain-containing protein [Actinomycetota bacterium]|nr:PH domain-containing protein [Actinomycetota bacterium]